MDISDFNKIYQTNRLTNFTEVQGWHVNCYGDT